MASNPLNEGVNNLLTGRKWLFLWYPDNTKGSLIRNRLGSDIAYPSTYIQQERSSFQTGWSLAFSNNFGLTDYNNNQLACLMLVSINGDPTSMTGPLFMIGNGGDGIGWGFGGSSDWTQTGSYVTSLIGGIQWGPNTANAWVKGLNVVTMGWPYPRAMMFHNLTSGVNSDSGTGAIYNSASNESHIYGSSNHKVHLVVFYITPSQDPSVITTTNWDNFFAPYTKPFQRLERTPQEVVDSWFVPVRRKPYLFIQAGANAYTLTAAKGTFTETGIASGLLYGRDLLASAGSFTETGKAANLLYGRDLVAGTGSFTESGQSAGLYHGYVLTSGKGTFTFTGKDATLTYTPVGGTFTLVADTGTFTFTGKDVNLLHGYLVSAGKGTFTETGVAAGLKVDRKITAGTGTFVESGQDAGFKEGYVLTCAAGHFFLTGQSARLIYSGATGSTVEFYRGVSKPTPVVESVSLNVHQLTDVGGGTYNVEELPSVSQDKTDSPNYEGYKVS